ncbi:MAG: FAD-binding oxidoreductase [Pseudomonadota bacterium]
MSWLHANGDRGVWPRTYYAAGVDFPDPFPPLRGEAEADLCVVGAGITGLSAALHAARAGMSVIVLEAQRVGWGASGRNGGQIGSGFNWDQEDLETRLGEAAAHGLWDLAEEAKALTKALISELAPAAGLREGILYTTQNKRKFEEYPAWAEGMAARYGTAYEVLDRAAVAARIGTRAYAGGVLDRSAAHCNPLAYTLGLSRACAAEGVAIHEGSEVLRIQPLVQTQMGRVRARTVLQATNGYSGGLSRVNASVLPINNYIAVTETLETTPFRTDFAVADSQFVVNYFRPTPDGRLLYGGGESYGKRFPSDIAAKVRRNLGRVYPELSEVRIDYAWGGTLAVTATRLPLLAELRPGLFAAGGYSGHGLALSGLFGKLVVEAITGDRRRFDLMAALPVPALPGGRVLGPWAAQAGMVLGALRDRVGW